MGVAQNRGYSFGGPYSQAYSNFGSILGSPYLGKLPYTRLTPFPRKTKGPPQFASHVHATAEPRYEVECKYRLG